MNQAFRGGMQVHAVPDDERALDSTGRTLPWGYAYPDPALNRKQPLERGPFGKTTSRRTLSRSKTATPSTKEDLQRLDNMKYQDEIFAKFKSEQTEAPTGILTAPVRDAGLPRTKGGPDFASGQAAAGPKKKTDTSAAMFSEPTEVMIHGYLQSHLPAAITFFETASLGIIYEDYERAPAPSQNPRYSNGLLNPGVPRGRAPRDLPPEALAKINVFRGGKHWIKVTFDSPLSAQRATSASPHVLGGCEVHASLWSGAGPTEDIALSTGRGGVAGTLAGGARRAPRSQQGGRPFSSFPTRAHAPNTFNESGSSTDTMGGTANSSSTAGGSGSTATAGGSNASSDTIQGTGDGLRQRDPFAATSKSDNTAAAASAPASRHQPRVRSATVVALKPAETALLPVAPWSVRAFGAIPIVGALVSSGSAAPAEGGGGIIGTTVPRDDKGEFDWARASLWWIVCWYIDRLFGTDLCGLRSED